jgi:hypothetical protein
MATTRLGLTATLLSDGRVLVAGGSKTPGGLGLATAELFDPSTGKFSPTGSMTAGRDLQTATLLSDGHVLIAGGQGSNGAWNSAELFDPATGKFTRTGTLTVSHGDGHTATLLADGRVMVAGGRDPGTNKYVASAELFDPATGKFAATASMAARRQNQTATLLTDGRVLVAGGSDGSAALASAELYQP